LVEYWQTEHKDAMVACDVEELVSECLELDDLVQHAWKSLSDLLFDGKIDDVETIGDKMRMALAKTQNALSLVNDAVSAAESRGHNIAKAEDFRTIRQRMDLVAEEFKETWPTANPQLAQQSLAAYRRGEYQGTENLLRKAQGFGSQTDH